ncbi:MAG: hypothetical protein QNJ22_07275 [Desulfosarcinaceae bacterium]|nr:hypothetical protein [Desulfosarcinaceae bacterium]
MAPLPSPRQQLLTDVSIAIDPAAVLLTLNRGRRIDRLNADMAAAVTTARRLIRPAAAMAWVRVTSVTAETVTLDSMEAGSRHAVSLNIGPHADLMAAAVIALISVGTIGDDLDAAVRELNHKGELLQAYLLDSAGVVALSEVGRAVREQAEAEASRRNWGVSPSLGPGTLDGWPLTGQRGLWGFLESDGPAGAAAIGITLGENGVLTPHKSATGLIGLGAAYRSRRVGSVCGFCQLRHTCWRRRNSSRAADGPPAIADP